MKKIFLTFADKRLQRSLDRIANQAETMGCYDTIITATEYDLDEEFRIRFSDKLRPEVRGFGYWSWKPQIILQTLEAMDEGDLLQYSDVGCWLNPAGKKRLQEYFELVSNEPSGVLAFQVKNTFGDPSLDRFSLPEYLWTKGDLFDYFAVRKKEAITHTEQIGAGVIFIKKCDTSRSLLHEWLQVFEDDFSLTNDSPSHSPNFKGFKEHRHDQSIFGILCKKYDVHTLSTFEYWYPSATDSTKPDWSKLETYPVWAKRDKDMGFWCNVTTHAKRITNKLQSLFN